MIINESSVRKVLPVASGKGGVGKSMITANLGILLASYAKQVILVDLDLGGSNLHTYLGLKNRNPGVGNFLSDKKLKFDQLAVETPYRNLSFIPGDVLVPNAANLTHAQRRSILRQLEKLDADYILLDLGSGTALNVIDFFLLSNSGIVIATPQTPAVLNAYNFLKNVVFRHLQRLEGSKAVTDYLKKVVKEQQPGATPTISSIVKGIKEIDAEGGRLAAQELAQLRPQMVVNMADAPSDLDLIDNFRELVSRNLEVQLGSLGLVYQDSAVRRSLKNLNPVTVNNADSVVTREIDRIAQKILQSPRFPTMPLDYSEYSDSFELTRIEAENDYADVSGEQEQGELGVSNEEFLSIIAMQKKQIEELRGTVRMLTMNQR